MDTMLGLVIIIGLIIFGIVAVVALRSNARMRGRMTNRGVSLDTDSRRNS